MFRAKIRELVAKIEELSGLPFRKFLISSLIVIAIGIYIANLIYGDNSFSRLNALRRKKEALKQEIENIKSENARLHKQYLEWSDAKR